MNNYYFYMIVVLVSFIYGINKLIKKGDVLYKMSYDYRRLYGLVLIIPYVAFEIISSIRQCDGVKSLNFSEIMTLGEHTSYCSNLLQSTIISALSLLLITLFIIFIDFLTFGVMNKKGIYLTRLLKYKKIKSYKIDESSNVIELVYSSIFNKTKHWYLKMEGFEMKEVTSILSKYVNN